MNKTKQFKRTALNLSAKSMVSTLLLLIAMLMPQGAWAISGSGTSSSPYLIANEADLRTFQQYVENGNSGIYGKLTADITLTSAWTRIGRADRKFTGYFDGQGHTISGMNLSFTAYEHGFFGFVNNATIKNFTLKGTMTSSANGNHSHGTVVGSAAGTTVIENVTSSVNLTLNHTDFTCIGGIVGHMDESSKVIGCTYTGTINLNKNSEQVGGIVGYAQRDLYITNNVFSGTITSTGTCKYLAGIAGKTDGTIEVSGCTNIGTINGGPSYDCVAGIVGYVQYQSRALITNCYFGGSLSSTSSGTSLVMGGILGAVNDDAGTNFRGLTYCFSDGTLTATNSSSTQIGGIAGVIKSKAVSKVLNNSYLSGKASRLAAISNNSSSFDSSNKAITISVTAGTGGTVNKSYVYPTSTTATQVKVEATPNSGYHYVEWSDNGAQTHNVSLANNVSLTATFGAHTYGNWSTDDDATCTKTGTKHRVCATCSAREDVTIAATGHGKTNGYTASYDWQGSASEPTCKFTLKCNDCKDSNNNPTVIVNGQSITTSTTGTYGYIKQTAHDDAKCTEAGYTTYQASGKYSDSNGKNASYTETTTSNSSNTETYTIAALGHGSTGYTPTYTWGGTYNAATCTFKLDCGLCGVEVFNDNIATTKVNANHVDASTCTNGNERWTATGSYSKAGDAAYNGTAQVKDYVILAVHTFDDATDPHHTLCTACSHSFIRYTSSTKEAIDPFNVTELKGANGATLDFTNTYVDGQGVIEFNSTLKTIGDDAFLGRSRFTDNLTIPNSVTSIGNNAFFGCYGFTGNLTIPNSVTSIGNGAFKGCSSLKGNLTIPNSVTSIGDDAFQGCSSLKGNLTIGNSVTSIGYHAFQGCFRFTGVEFQSVPQIGSDAFNPGDCPKTVVLSDDSNVYKGDNPYFPTVTSVTAPCSLDLTGSAVEYHPNLTRTHTFTEESYVDGHCSVCGDDLGPMTVTLGNGEVRKYNSLQDAINYIVNLRMNGATLTLHQDLTLEGNEDINIYFGEDSDDFNFTIDLNGHTITGSRKDKYKSFWIDNSKSGLPTLTIANSCQDKKGKLFNCCLDLNENTKVIVSEGVSIYPKFENLPLISSVVYINSATSSLVNYGDLYGDVDVHPGSSFINNGRVEFVYGEFENNGDYCAYFNWADDGSSFSAYVYGSIYDYNEEDEEASITSEVTKEPTCSEPGVRTFTGSFIGNLPFGGQEFTDTKEVEIPATGQHTFAASDLTHDVCTVCNHGFLRYEAGSQQNPYKAENLKDKGDNTLTIESHTFNDHQGVMEFNAPLVKIGDLAFFFKQFTKITIPNTVEIIGATAFSSNRLLSAIEIPNSVKIIGSSAFADCIALTKITLGSSVEKINGYAFSCDEDQSDKDFDITLKSLPQFVNCDYPEIFHYKCIYYDEYVGCVGVEDRPIPANFELDDNSYVAPESSLGSSCIANHVTYTRTGIKNQWGTIVVPFEVNGSGDDYDLYTLSGVSNEELTLTKVSGTLAAGTPALIRLHDKLAGNYDLTLTAANNAVSGQLAEGTEADGYQLAGTYETTELDDNNYFISKNMFWEVGDVSAEGVKVAPFRAYIHPAGAGSNARRNAPASPTELKRLDADGNGVIETADIELMVASILNGENDYNIGDVVSAINNAGTAVISNETLSNGVFEDSVSKPEQDGDGWVWAE